MPRTRRDSSSDRSERPDGQHSTGGQLEALDQLLEHQVALDSWAPGESRLQSAAALWSIQTALSRAFQASNKWHSQRPNEPPPPRSSSEAGATSGALIESSPDDRLAGERRLGPCSHSERLAARQQVAAGHSHNITVRPARQQVVGSSGGACLGRATSNKCPTTRRA